MIFHVLVNYGKPNMKNLTRKLFGWSEAVHQEAALGQGGEARTECVSNSFQVEAALRKTLPIILNMSCKM